MNAISKMRWLVVFAALHSAIVFGQPAQIADSSRIVLPNNVTIELVKTQRGGSATYELNEQNIQTIVAHLNYLHRMQELTEHRIKMLNRQLALADSSTHVWQTKFRSAEDRLAVYSSGYEELKSVTSAYDKQIKSMTDDLHACRKEKRRARRATLLKGVGTGLAGGLLIGALIFLSR